MAFRCLIERNLRSIPFASRPYKIGSTCARESQYYITPGSLLVQSGVLISYFSTNFFPLQRGCENGLTCRPISSISVQKQSLASYELLLLKWQHIRCFSNKSVTLRADDGVTRFYLDQPDPKVVAVRIREDKKPKKFKKSRNAKRTELRFYRLKAKKKMKSPNPEVRIRYKLEKAKRKEEWLIEKLRKYDNPALRTEDPADDPEILTEEEKFYLKRTGEKKKNYVPVGVRGVFGGVVLNMHLHWKKHETLKVICKPCKPGQVDEYANELARLSKGIVIDIKANNTILMYRGKNYVQPEVMSPTETLSKRQALEKYRFEQSLDHTSQFIEKLEKELEEYHNHVALYKKGREIARETSEVVVSDTLLSSEESHN
ncbi:putative CRM domain-containing protein [Acorus calamus]|uniref:CRM domain-containing protein n=1 Tax=Acorus calamus TaxID=4465 RepID=A0AAV9EZL6_ACOCL|nr:putative CRM domain-containing protein [Acorus calamus]